MSVYNCEKYLGKSIESILKQTFIDFEFIIIDDCSTDDSYKIIKSYNDERIKVIRNKSRRGLTKNLNTAIAIAKGKYIARQDSDDLSLPQRFETQIKFLEENPEVALVGSSVFLIDHEDRVIGVRKAPQKPRQVLKQFNAFNHGSVIMRKEAVDRLGGYNELFKYSQDYELWLRFSKFYDMANIQTPLYALRVHRKDFAKLKEQYLYLKLAKKIHINKIRLDQNIESLISVYGVENIIRYLTPREKLQYYRFITLKHIGNTLCLNQLGRCFLKAYGKIKEVFLQSEEKLQYWI